MTDSAHKPRGFAALTPERRKAIARLGGTSVPAHKRSFAVDRELASTAGAKGGSAPSIDTHNRRGAK